jgi:hypothetical protein
MNERCIADALVVLRVRMGFPAEVFAMAVQPIVDAYLEHARSMPALDGPRCGVRGCRDQGLVTALRALDHRRGLILPRNAAPEVQGALGHRWTYAVFVAGLLQSLGVESGLPARLYERWVPPGVRDWLHQDSVVACELNGVLSGEPAPESAIAAVVRRAAARTWPVPEEPASSSGPRTEGVVAAMQPVEPSPLRPSHAPAWLDPVPTHEPQPARQFMVWLRERIADGTLPANVPGALVHGVAEGLLLVSPGIFHAYLKDHEQGSRETRDAAKRLQRAVLRAGWHLRSETGVNLLGYRWKRAERADAALHGIVIVDPRRFMEVVPALNPALAPVAEARLARNP